MRNIIAFVKRENVLVISAILAVISCFFVPPDSGYAEYIDMRVLALLFALMAVMAGFRHMYVFSRIGRALLTRTKSTRGLCSLLVLLCFFSSMLVTNDVALITFVPFTVEVLTMCDKKKLMVPVIVLQTIAANLGSMLTPPGNPQNLYIYSVSGMSAAEFMAIMLPFTLLSLILLLVSILFLGSEKTERLETKIKYPAIHRVRLYIYIALFIISLLAVLRIIPYYIPAGLALIYMVVADRRVLINIDYGLLLTFVSLFVLVGNLARIPVIYDFISGLTEIHPFAVSVGASQIISNVPAALLVSGFTSDYTAVLKGVNVGGLGTIIASMASLISYKIYASVPGAKKGRYMLVFTILNVVFLTALCALELISESLLK